MILGSVSMQEGREPHRKPKAKSSSGLLTGSWAEMSTGQCGPHAVGPLGCH